MSIDKLKSEQGANITYLRDKAASNGSVGIVNPVLAKEINRACDDIEAYREIVGLAQRCIELLSFNFGGWPGPNGATNPQLEARDALAAALKKLEQP